MDGRLDRQTDRQGTALNAGFLGYSYRARQ